MGKRTSWPEILEAGADIVRSYDTLVTLRQLFYRLVAIELLANTTTNYKTLSKRTAEARRSAGFPNLVDRTRSIHRPLFFDGAEDAKTWLSRIYRRDRTEGQEYGLYLGVEKNGIVNQLEAWFGDLGIPILALGGYTSQSYVDEVIVDIGADGREAILIYAGDFHPSGEDILRDFEARTACFAKVERIALNADQVTAYDLPPQMGKAEDSRAAQFVARHGRLVQVELDALPPDVLQSLYGGAIERYWDTPQYDAILAAEAAERAELVQR